MPISVAADSNKSAFGNRQLVIVTIASFATIVPAILWGIPSNLDLTNHFRFALPFYDALVAGDLYPGWLAESNGGYGDPSFRFYPPGFYYLLAAARLLIGNWYGATLAVFVTLSIAGGLGMHFWARSFLPPWVAAWAGILYSIAPYRVNQLYQASMLAEWAGGAVLPFVFAFVDRVCVRGKAKDIAGLAATYGLLLFTHLPLAVIGSIALLAYALVRTGGGGKLRKITRLSFAAVLGLSVSAAYWITMISEVDWIAGNTIETDLSLDYRYNFLLSTFSPDNLNVWWTNILLLMTLLLSAPLVIFCFKRSASLRRATRPLIVLTLFSLLMTLPLSRPLWNALRPLQETQFPWRWMVIFTMGISILTAAALPLVLNNEIKLDRAKRMLIFGAMTIGVTFTLSHSVREAQYLSQPVFENTIAAVRGSPSINYWLPNWTRPNPRKMGNEVEVEDRAVKVTAWQAEYRKFSVAPGLATEARIRTFYYPHWTATNEARLLETRPDKDGALLISLPPEATSVELEFREPRRSKISTIISWIGLILIGGLALPFRWRKP